MSRTLTARQTELAGARAIRAVPLVTITTYSDIYAGTVDVTLRMSDRTLRYAGNEYQAHVITLGDFRETMNHLPDPAGDASGTLRRELSITLRNGLHDSGVYLSEYLRAHSIERARVVVSQLLLYADEMDNFAVVDAMAGTEHTVLFRGEVRQIERVDQSEIDLRCGNLVPNIPWVIVPDGADADTKDVGKRLNLVYGEPKLVPLHNLVVGALSTTAGYVAKDATYIELTDASRFSTSGNGRLLYEAISWTGKTGNTLTGVTRAQESTLASEHLGGSTIIEMPTSVVLGLGMGVTDCETLYVRNLLNDQLMRVSQLYTVDTTDTTTISGASISTLSMTAAEASGIIWSAVSQARVTQQPNFSTTTPSTSTATNAPSGADYTPTDATAAEGSWSGTTGATPLWTYANGATRTIFQRVFGATGLSASDEVIAWRLRIGVNFAGSLIQRGAAMVLAAYSVPGMPDGTSVGVASWTHGDSLADVGPWYTPPVGTVMTDLIGAWLIAVPTVNESDVPGREAAMVLNSTAWGIEAYVTTTALLHRLSDTEITAAAGGVGLDFYGDLKGQLLDFTAGATTQKSSCDATTGWGGIDATLSITTTSPSEGTGALRIVPGTTVGGCGAYFDLPASTDLRRRCIILDIRMPQTMIDVLDPVYAVSVGVVDGIGNYTSWSIPYAPTADTWDVAVEWWTNNYTDRDFDDADLSDIVRIHVGCSHSVLGTVTTERMDVDNLRITDAAVVWDRQPTAVIVTPTDIERHLHTVICGQAAASFDDAAKVTATTNLDPRTELHVPLNYWGTTYEELVGRLAYESRTQFILRENTSASQIYASNAEMGTSGYSWPAAGVTLTQWQSMRERGRSTEELATSYRLLYDRDWSLDGVEAYRAAASVTKGASDLTHAPTSAIDRARINVVEAEPILLDSITDAASLDVIGGYYVRAGNEVPRILEVQGVPWVEAFALERADIVSLTPTWASSAIKARVIEVTKDWRSQLIDLVVVEVT